MANFKRGRAKNRRSGCLLCKPWKMNGAKATVRDTPQEIVAKLAEREQVAEYAHGWWNDFDDLLDGWMDGGEVCSDPECPECNWQEILTGAQSL